MIFIGLIFLGFLIYLATNYNSPKLKKEEIYLEDRLSKLEQNRFDESKVNEFINSKIKDLEKRKFSSKIQILKNTEHISYLESKLSEANNYIIITSGWITKSVVNDEFVGLLKRKIHQNVKVLFVYGYKFNRKHNGSDDALIKRNKIRALLCMQNGCQSAHPILQSIINISAELTSTQKKYDIKKNSINRLARQRLRLHLH